MADFPFDLSKLDLGSMMDMAKNLKDQIAQAEASLGAIEVEAMVGGGMVVVKANARGELISVTIDPELIEMKDQAMTENLVLMGVNQALAEARQKREETMQKIAGPMAIPGMFS